jgi:dihydropteroate synthase
MTSADLAGIKVGDDIPAVVVGAINLSPNSFYAESYVKTPEGALRKALEMIEGGAGIIDIGAMSTAPRTKPISERTERQRLIRTVKFLCKEIDAPISVDTQRASIAEEAISAGAQVVNDVSGLKADERMAGIISRLGCSAIIMACKNKPGDAKTIEEVIGALKESLKICEREKIDLQKIVIDPGIGFGKGTKWDLHILSNLEKLSILKRPIYVAVSRKTFIGEVLGLKNPADRLFGSLGATIVALLKGARIIRTHDPKETLQAIRVAEAILRAKV